MTFKYWSSDSIYLSEKNADVTFIAKLTITKDDANFLIADSFFNWWFYGDIPSDALKETYQMLDSKLDSIPKSLFPEGKKFFYIYIKSADKRRLYALESVDRDSNNLYYFYINF